LSEAIEALPPLHAAVFELAVIQGLPYADIASALEIPEGTVKSRVFHALRKLRAALENEGDA
jgi:RNA polymerase sigma-70 factor (ECF subfamily)